MTRILNWLGWITGRMKYRTVSHWEGWAMNVEHNAGEPGAYFELTVVNPLKGRPEGESEFDYPGGFSADMPPSKRCRIIVQVER
jgi:hypothetical protein